jgi:multidrug efflux pump subunit AcrB
MARKVAEAGRQGARRHRHFRRLAAAGIDWALEVDRAKAAQYGVSPMSVGVVVQLVTGGLKLTDYRPEGADDAVDIRPASARRPAHFVGA